MFRTAEVRTWFDWNAKAEVEVMEEFQLESCVRGHHAEYTRVRDSVVGGSTFCGFAASRSMLRLTLVFAFSRSFCVGVDDSHVIFLGSVQHVGPSRKKKTCTKPFCLYTFRLHFAFVQWLNDIDKILADIKFGRN